MILLTAVGAQARLGETESQLINRFGPEGSARTALIPGTLHLIFEKQGFSIDVSLINGSSADEIYNDEKGDISPDKTDYLLKANSQGRSWTEQTTDTNGWHWWKRDDGARAYRRGSTFELRSSAYWEKERAYRKSQESRVDGF